MDGQRDEQHDDADDRDDPATGGDRPRPDSRRLGSAELLRRIGLVVAVLAVALGGAVLGVLAGGRVDTDIGPFRANLSISPPATAAPPSTSHRWARCCSTATTGRPTSPSAWAHSTRAAPRR